MLKYNITMNMKPDPERDLWKISPIWNGKNEFSIMLADDWETIELREAFREHGISVGFAHHCDSEPEGNFTVYTSPVEYEPGDYTELPIAWMVLDHDYRRIPDEYNEALITV